MAIEFNAWQSLRLTTRRVLFAAAWSIRAFCSSSVSLSPKKLPFGYTIAIAPTCRCWMATAYTSPLARLVLTFLERPATSPSSRRLRRLREARDRLLLRPEHVEHQRQLGDDEDVLDAV